MTRPLRPALLVLLTLTLAFAGCGRNGASKDTGKSAADTVPDGIPSYEEPKDAKEVTLLLNEDRWGEVAPCGCKKRPAGGLPRLATVIEKYKASDGAIVVEVGDSLYPPLVHQRETSERMDARAEFIMDALPAMGLDVYVPGGADMEIGLDKLLTWRDEKKVPMVAANINDASTQQPLFDAYKIFEHDGVKVALIGVAGPTSYAAARANADYQPKLREQARRRAAKGGGSRLLARLRDDWSAAANKGDSEAQKHLVQKMMGEADFGGREGNKPAKDEELPAEDAYTGRRFRIVDPVVSVNRVIDEIGGKADILIAVANVDDAEMEALRTKAPRLHFIVDGYRDAYGGAAGIERSERPHPLTVGNKGKYVGLVKIRVVDGDTKDFVDMGARIRAVESLKRLDRAWDRLVQRADGEDPLVHYEKDSRYYRRAAALKRRIDELTAKASYSPEGNSYFEVEQIMLDKAYPADPALEARMHQVEGTEAEGAKGTS